MNPILSQVLQFLVAGMASLLNVPGQNKDVQARAIELVDRLREQKLIWIVHEFYLPSSTQGKAPYKIGTKKTLSTEPWFPRVGEYVMLSSGDHSEPFRIAETVHCDLGVTKHVVLRGWEDPEIKGVW